MQQNMPNANGDRDIIDLDDMERWLSINHQQILVYKVGIDQNKLQSNKYQEYLDKCIEVYNYVQNAKLLKPFLLAREEVKKTGKKSLLLDIDTVESACRSVGNYLTNAIAHQLQQLQQQQQKFQQNNNQFYQPPPNNNNDNNVNNNVNNNNINNNNNNNNKSKPRPQHLLNVGCGCSRGGAPCLTRSCRCRKEDTACINVCSCVNVCCNPMGVHP
jgi:hypothetical protein